MYSSVLDPNPVQKGGGGSRLGGIPYFLFYFEHFENTQKFGGGSPFTIHHKGREDAGRGGGGGGSVVWSAEAKTVSQMRGTEVGCASLFAVGVGSGLRPDTEAPPLWGISPLARGTILGLGAWQGGGGGQRLDSHTMDVQRCPSVVRRAVDPEITQGLP